MSSWSFDDELDVRPGAGACRAASQRELDTVPADELKKGTPNISGLKSGVKGLYGSYSEIAHSSAKRHLKLLGSDESGYGWTSLVPKFSTNSYVLRQNADMVSGVLDLTGSVRGRECPASGRALERGQD